MPKLPRVVGYDAETPLGRVGCLTAWDEAAGTERIIENEDTDALLQFLWDSHGGEGLHVFWNLGFDTAAILKPFVEAHVEELHAAHYRLIRLRQREQMNRAEADALGWTKERTEEALALRLALDGIDNIDRFDTARFHVQRIGEKGFGIRPKKAKKREGTRWFFDAEPFYSPGGFQHVPLGEMARKYLGEQKTAEAEGIDRASIGKSRAYYRKHREAILRYCVNDARLTARLMVRTVEAYEKLGFPFPERPFSKGSISKEYLRLGGMMDATQERYQELRMGPDRGLWTRSFRGGVFLLLGMGTPTCPELEIHDLNSAYPDALLSLPSLDGAFLVESSDPRYANAFFKFHRVRLAHGVPFVPERDETGEYTRLLYRWTDTPRSVTLTEPDLTVLRERGCEFVLEESIGVVCPSGERPFGFLAAVFEKKAAIKKEFGEESVEYLAIKIVANGFYGILAQRKPRESKWTNLIYASYVTAICRERLWRRAAELEARGGRIIQYATDGLVSWPAKGTPTLPSSDALGAWEVTSYETATFFETGIYVAKRPHKPEKLKRRGFPDLTPERLRRCRKPFWASRRNAPLKLKSAIIRRRAEAICVFEPTERTLHPYDSARGTGAVIPPALKRAPLRDYFRKWWWLELGRVGKPPEPTQKAE